MVNHNLNRFQIISTILKELSLLLVPGVTGLEIEKAAEALLETYGAKSYNKGYKPTWSETPFPSVICISPNQIIAHGIPNAAPFLQGDIVNLDMGIIVDGLCADAAMSVAIEPLENKNERLLRYAKQTLYVGIDKLRVGNTVRDVAHAMQTFALQRGYKINKNFCGHGIGKEMHMPPKVYHTVEKNDDFDYDYTFKEGEIICLEPMLTFKDDLGVPLNDGWGRVTFDGKYSAMFEHMVLITNGDPQILTTHFTE